MRNDCLTAALQELDAAGIRDIARAYGGKHMQIRWQVNGTERMYVLPITPSDIRAAANAPAAIRRILRRRPVDNGAQTSGAENAGSDHAPGATHRGIGAAPRRLGAAQRNGS